MDTAKKKDLTMYKPEEDKDQACESTAKGDKCTKLREDMSLSRSSISISMRIGQKLKFQENGKELPRTTEIVWFFTKITL